jgi:hypothetical protein
LNGSLFAHMRRSAVLVTKKEPDTASFKTPDLRNVLMTARISTTARKQRCGCRRPCCNDPSHLAAVPFLSFAMMSIREALTMEG